MASKPVPDGYHSLTPYVTVTDAPAFISFIERAFGGQVSERITDDKGDIRHAEVRVGDSVLMLGEACEGWPATPTGFYLYVGDCDAAYKRAVEAGGKSIMEPADQFYGDRNGGVEDPAGNKWWIATRQEELSHDELQRRANEAMKKQAS